MEINKIYNEDCLEGMKRIADGSVDMILCDLPFAKTGYKLDKVLPIDTLWEQYKRIITDRGIIALFGVEPFTSHLIISNMEMYRYKWAWQKEQGSNWQLAKLQPLNVLEDICIFSHAKSANGAKETAIYYPIMKKRDVPSKSGGKPSVSDILHKNSMEALHKTYEVSYPINLLKYNRVHSSKRLHPTQKPVELCEYLIKTYTNESDLVLDNCMGSGTTAIACMNTQRNFIGFERDKGYYDIACKRIKEHKETKDIKA